MGALLNLLISPIATYLISGAVNLVRGAGLSDKGMLVLVGFVSAAVTGVDTWVAGNADPSNVVGYFLAGLASTFFHQLKKKLSGE